MIKKRCFVCGGIGRYGRLLSNKSIPQKCWVCHGTGTLIYPYNSTGKGDIVR